MASSKSSDTASSKLVANITKDPKKQKALEAAMDQIERQFGKGAIMRLGQNELMDIEAIPTGRSRSWTSVSATTQKTISLIRAS